MRMKAMVSGTLDLVLLGGLALGMAVLTGCGSSGNGGNGGSGGGGGGGTTPSGTLAAGGAANIYAIEEPGAVAGPSSVLTFGISTADSPSPTQTLVLPNTMTPSAVATDSSGQIYVGGESLADGNAQILVYAAGSTGTATPTRTIELNATSVELIISMAVDSSGKIYAAGYDENENGTIAIIPGGANGTTTPSPLLTSTTLATPIGVAVDTSGKIYVSDVGETSGQILVFAAGATGSDAPVETISTATATATTASVFYGLSVDGSGNIFAVLDSGVLNSSGDITSESVAVEEFAAGATGVATPTKTIAVSTTGITEGGGLRLDSVGNIYLITEADVNGTNAITLLGFGPNASGDVAPGFTIVPSALSNAASQIAVH